MRASTDRRIIEALRGRGYKVTPQRLAICRLALADRSHPSAASIYEKVRRVHPTVSLATVYKTVQVLREVGLAGEVCPTALEGRIDTRPGPHINLICQRCGAITDVTDHPFESVAADIATRSGLLADIQRIDVLGHCLRCARAGRA